MSVQAKVPDDHPLMIAWRAYTETDDYKNALKWAVYEEHAPGSLWGAFSAGFSIGDALEPRAEEPSETSTYGSQYEALTSALHEQAEDGGGVVWVHDSQCTDGESEDCPCGPIRVEVPAVS